jgi:hypothetical protein
MPLTKIFRLGATPQRIIKGYVLDGSPQDVAAFGSKINGSSLAPGVTVVIATRAKRSIHLHTDWWLLHDAYGRRNATQTLTTAVVALAAGASRNGCMLLPSASRPSNDGSWGEWTCGDDHQVALSSATEVEVVNNVIRTHAAALIALTGRSGIDGSIENLGSRRLAGSTEHLATRYLTSGSPRNLTVVASELRRTSGLKNLAAMDVHPASEGPEGLSCVIRCIDAQAFVGTAMAHAILLQALAMHARRLVRDGRRQGNVPQELLENQRTQAIISGLDARVPVEQVRSSPAGRNRKATDTAAMQVLVRELSASLMPEFGTLEVEFGEIAPVLGWTVGVGNLPRTETELHASRGHKDAQALARAIAIQESHASFNRLAESEEVRAAGRSWERRANEPPRGSRRSQPRTEKSTKVRALDSSVPAGMSGRTSHRQRPEQRQRGQSPRERQGGNSGQNQNRSRVMALSALAVSGSDDWRHQLADAIRALPNPDTELVPRLSPKDADLVRLSRANSRPAGPHRIRCDMEHFAPEASAVMQARRKCHEYGASLLTLSGTVPQVEAARPTALKVIGSFSEGLAAILCVSRFKDGKSGEQRASLEILFVRQGEAQ